MSRLEDKLESLAKYMGWSFEKEYRFHPIRRWRFDFADLDNKIGIECEGGAFINGRHSRGTGMVKDTEKYNQATILGWRLLRYASSKQIDEQFINDYESIKKEKH